MDTRENGRGGDGRISIEERTQRSCLPYGRRAWAIRPNWLPGADIAAGILLLQSVRGGYGRQMCRQADHSTGGVRSREAPREQSGVRLFKSICAILAKCKPRAVPHAPATGFSRRSGAAIPSLRAHKPNPAARDPSGPSRRILENLALAARNNPKLFPGRTLLNLSSRLPSEWDRDASVHEPAHPDIHCHTERQERKQHRRSTVTH